MVDGGFLGHVGGQIAQTVDAQVSLLKGIGKQVDGLAGDIKEFDAHLIQASKNPRSNNNDVLKNVVSQIREVVMKGEDAICNYMVEKKKHEDKGLLKYFELPAYFSKVTRSAKKINAIRHRVREIRKNNAASLKVLIKDGSEAQPAVPVIAPVVEEVDVVGFDSDAKLIKDLLMEGPADLTVISIEGMAGLGKTTLTKMVFKDREFEDQFLTRLWIHVSKMVNRRQIFLDILSKFTENTNVFQDMSDENLGERIKGYLEGQKYFVVVDDVWTEDDWNTLKIAFPNNKKGSRILLTTRVHNVASHAASTGKPHQLNFLSNDESWELLDKKVFRQERCPLPLVETGKCIARKCNGLPLAVVVIAGVLNKDSRDQEWKRIAEDPFPTINKENLSYNKLVRLSYDHLQSYYLQDCFLYLAVFPSGHEIAASKLIHLWISEGIIRPIDGGNSSELEVIGEKYLKELVDRNLLMVLKRRADGQIKTCQIHDTLHEFCKTEAASKNLFREMNGGEFEQNKMPRRICVHSSIIEFLRSKTKTSGEHVHSFLSSCSNEIDLAVILKYFPFLRVMDVESLKLNNKLLPTQLYQLYNLRYLAVSTDLKVLPTGFSDLWNMVTLVVKTSADTLEVKADIWSMSKLRHVHSNTSMVLPPPRKNAKNNSRSTNILTLSTISPSSCTREILEMTPNLRKLGIRGNLAELMESKGGFMLFDNLQILYCLENLKLINNALHNSKLRCPRSEKFPPRLTKMTLSNTTFQWKDLKILSSLKELEVLKLEENAFRGEDCDASNIFFKQLRYLRIGRTNLVSWKVSKDSFPALKYLILRHCDALESVPSEFGEVESLEVMELLCTNARAANSAREIQKLKNERKCGFQLSISPPDQ